MSSLVRAVADDIPAEDRVRLGMLTPSSNTILEPVCGEMLRCLPEVSVHFGRFRVTEISHPSEATAQFAREPMLQAASVLAAAAPARTARLLRAGARYRSRGSGRNAR